jgi:uncharacterized cysteine cluster protein YcgN (CxxCxxCC family)
MENLKYESYLKTQFEKFEAMCRKCGECCGLRDGDPCANLTGNPESGYHCNNYENRLGIQKTTSGNVFVCVPIRDLVKSGFYSPNCPYIST